MGDRAAQIRAEWFVKCASVVLQARVPSPSPAAAAGKDRQNRWFNLETEERASHAEALRPWRPSSAARTSSIPSTSRRMTLEIFLESDGGVYNTKTKRVLVERWVFRHDARVSAGGPDSQSNALSVSVAYKQLVVFFRTLHAELRALPAHRYARRAAERSASGDHDRGGFKVGFKVSGFEPDSGGETREDSKPPPLERAEEKWSEPPHSGGDSGRASDTSTSLGMSGVSSSGVLSSGLLHSSSSEGTGSIPSDDAPKRSRPSSRQGASSDAYRTYAFAPAAAPGGGRLDASVYFLDADALAALDLGDACSFKAFKPKLVDAYAHEARGGSGSGSDGYASSPGGFPDKKATGAKPRRAGSWKARATQFLATSPGSAKVGFAARPEPEDVDTPPPPSRVGIVLAGSGDAGTPPPGGSRGLLSAEMARFEPSAGIVHPSSFVGSPSVGSPSAVGSVGSVGSVPEKRHEGNNFASGPATPSSWSRPPLSPLAPSSAPVSGPPPIFGFAESDGFRERGSPAGSGSGGGFLSALASRLASSPGMAIPGVGTLPFAFGSGSGSRGSGSESSSRRRGHSPVASLASPSHALAARETDGVPADRRLTAHVSGSLSSAENNSSDSPPWHFRGLLVPSGSPGATAPWRVDRNPSVGGGGGVSRRASWSSPSSSLSVSFHSDVAGFANQKGTLPGGPFAYGTSPRFSGLALGSSPESVAGTPGHARHAGMRLERYPSGIPGDAGVPAGIVPGDTDPRGGPRRLVSAFAAESADDALPFELDVEEEEDTLRKSPKGSRGDGEEEVDTSASDLARTKLIDPGYDADAAVAALVRALREAPPLSLQPGSDKEPARAITLAGAKRRLASMRREVVMARRHRGGISSSSLSGSSRASSEAEKREAAASVEGCKNRAMSDEEKAKRRTEASVAVDAAVDEALAFLEPASGR